MDCNNIGEGEEFEIDYIEEFSSQNSLNGHKQRCSKSGFSCSIVKNSIPIDYSQQ